MSSVTNTLIVAMYRRLPIIGGVRAVEKSAPIIGRTINQMLDFLTRTKIKFFGRSKIGANNQDADNRKSSVVSMI